jgi:hypothetical protein
VSDDENTTLPRAQYIKHKALLRTSRNLVFVVKHRLAINKPTSHLDTMLYQRFIEAVEAFGEVNL